jgi:hypothetical protein
VITSYKAPVRRLQRSSTTTSRQTSRRAENPFGALQVREHLLQNLIDRLRMYTPLGELQSDKPRPSRPFKRNPEKSLPRPIPHSNVSPNDPRQTAVATVEKSPRVAKKQTLRKPVARYRYDRLRDGKGWIPRPSNPVLSHNPQVVDSRVSSGTAPQPYFFTKSRGQKGSDKNVDTV